MATILDDINYLMGIDHKIIAKQLNVQPETAFAIKNMLYFYTCGKLLPNLYE